MGERCADYTFLGQPDTLAQGFTQGMHFPAGFSLGMEGKGRQTSVCSKGFKEVHWKKLN